MKKILFIILIILGISSIYASDVGIDWTRVAPNTYVDENTIIGTTDRYGYSFLLKSYNKGQYEPVNDRKILYTLGQYEIDCYKKKYKIGIIDSYDDNGYFVFGDYNRYAEFQPIVQGTAISELYKKLCKVN